LLSSLTENRSKTLSKIDLSENPLSPPALLAIAHELEINEHLSELCLASIPGIDDDMMLALGVALVSNQYASKQPWFVHLPSCAENSIPSI